MGNMKKQQIDFYFYDCDFFFSIHKQISKLSTIRGASKQVRIPTTNT